VKISALSADIFVSVSGGYQNFDVDEGKSTIPVKCKFEVFNVCLSNYAGSASGYENGDRENTVNITSFNSTLFYLHLDAAA
jgi:hypothetical protein